MFPGLGHITSREGALRPIVLKVGRKFSWLRHWVGDISDKDMNPVTAITFSRGAIHVPIVYTLQRHQNASSSHTKPILCLKILELVKMQDQAFSSSHASYHCHDIIEILLLCHKRTNKPKRAYPPVKLT